MGVWWGWNRVLPCIALNRIVCFDCGGAIVYKQLNECIILLASHVCACDWYLVPSNNEYSLPALRMYCDSSVLTIPLHLYCVFGGGAGRKSHPVAVRQVSESQHLDGKA